MNKKYDIESAILKNCIVAKDTIAMEFHAPQIAQNVLPGQFVMVETPTKFLRRPLSVAGVDGNRITLIIRKVGEGTKILTSLRRNTRLKMLGPLGNSFPKIDGRKILVAGGIGIAPLLLYANCFPKNSDFVYGEKNSEYLLDENYLPKNIKISTDDGSRGFAGNACDLSRTLEHAPILACGPEPMLAEVINIAAEWNVPAFVSLESRMACGFGVCNGCAIETTQGFKKICTDGPVFPAEILILSI